MPRLFQEALVQFANGKRQTHRWIMSHTLQLTRVSSGLHDDYRSGPVGEVLPSRTVVQCRMPSVQGAVKIKGLFA